MKISCVQVVWVGPQGSRTRESEGEGVCALQLHELDARRFLYDFTSSLVHDSHGPTQVARSHPFILS